MKKVRAAIVGASGYSGEELLRLLLAHPGCEISVITSRQHDGKRVGEVFPRFAEEELRFSSPDAAAIAATCDAAFLALPHGLANEFALPLVESGVTVFDISADFRLRDPRKYAEYYQAEHPSPQLLAESVYGLPEIYRGQIAGARMIACAGCYPTSIILPLHPLLKRGLVSPKGIVAASMSGVTGAGRKVDLPYIFPECNESLRAYSPTGHRHLPEIEQELAAAAGIDELAINFIPHLAPVNRGINSTIVVELTAGADTAAIQTALVDAYAQERFARVLPPGKCADTKHVTFTNTCEIAAACDGRTGKVIITSAIDNLTKGAAGQAVQCFNVKFGFDEAAGLR